jgi:hypothetical protein
MGLAPSEAQATVFQTAAPRVSPASRSESTGDGWSIVHTIVPKTAAAKAVGSLPKGRERPRLRARRRQPFFKPQPTPQPTPNQPLAAPRSPGPLTDGGPNASEERPADRAPSRGWPSAVRWTAGLAPTRRATPSMVMTAARCCREANGLREVVLPASGGDPAGRHEHADQRARRVTPETSTTSQPPSSRRPHPPRATRSEIHGTSRRRPRHISCHAKYLAS